MGTTALGAGSAARRGLAVRNRAEGVLVRDVDAPVVAV
jgi:hypothetical protein